MKRVLAIGVFDGMHKGHLAVVKKLKARARALKARAAVLTFDGPPERVIAPAYAPPTLTGLAHKLELLKAAGAAEVLVQRFDRSFARLGAERFVERLKRMGVAEVVVGSDFVFGAQARGDAELMRRMGLKVWEIRPASLGGRPVSSTRIRHALSQGRLREVAALLGRSFQLRGRVVRGKRLGRSLGFPTANLDLEHEAVPKAGVWGGRARVPGGKWSPALMNLGWRPTLRGRRFITEVHLLDFSGNLYGRKLEAEPQVYLRPEKRFESLEALQEQIRRDESRFRRLPAFYSARRSSGAQLG